MIKITDNSPARNLTPRPFLKFKIIGSSTPAPIHSKNSSEAGLLGETGNLGGPGSLGVGALWGWGT